MIQLKLHDKVSPSNLTTAQAAFKKLQVRQDLGYVHLPERDENWKNASTFADNLRKKYSHLVVVGLGGSALGGKCLVDSLGDAKSVTFLYNTDPKTVDKVLANKQIIEKSHFLFISKSGGTLELACILDILLVELKKINRATSDAISVITEEKPSPLYDWAKSNKISCLAHPQDVGGRFSAFTPVGLVPAIFSGIDANEIRAGAKAAVLQNELIAELAAFYVESFKRGEIISVFWAYIDEIAAFMPWLVQLWAESLAKKLNRAGQSAPQVSMPVAFLGTCDQHSVLQLLMEGASNKSIAFIRSRELANSGAHLSGVGFNEFNYIKGRNLGSIFNVQSVSTEEALREAGRTTISLELEKTDARALAQLMMTFELLIGVIGEILNINAFDQPGVELGKKITKEKLQKNARD